MFTYFQHIFARFLFSNTVMGKAVDQTSDPRASLYSPKHSQQSFKSEIIKNVFLRSSMLNYRNTEHISNPKDWDNAKAKPPKFAICNALFTWPEHAYFYRKKFLWIEHSKTKKSSFFLSAQIQINENALASSNELFLIQRSNANMLINIS